MKQNTSGTEDVSAEKNAQGKRRTAENEGTEKTQRSMFIIYDKKLQVIRRKFENTIDDKPFEEFLYIQVLDLMPGYPLPERYFSRITVPDISSAVEEYKFDGKQPPYSVVWTNDYVPVGDIVYRIVNDIPILSAEDTSSRPGYRQQYDAICRSMPDLSDKMTEILGRPVRLIPLKYFYFTSDESNGTINVQPAVSGTDTEFHIYMLEYVKNFKPGRPLPSIFFSRFAYNPESGMEKVLNEPDSEDKKRILLSFTHYHPSSSTVFRAEDVIYSLEKGSDPFLPETSSSQLIRIREYEHGIPDISKQLAAKLAALRKQEESNVHHVPSLKTKKKEGVKL